MKKVALILAGAVAVLMVGGAAFMAAQMIFAPETEAGGSGERMMIGSRGGAGGPVSFSLDIKPAPELPAGQPEAAGIFVRREDNSIFIGTGEIMLRAEIDPATGQSKMDSSYSGPVLEVVVSRDTAIYRDETSFPSPDQANPSSGKLSVQQVVQPVDSLNELGKIADNTEFQVWGERRGDRIVAQVVVYRPPAFRTRQ